MSLHCQWVSHRIGYHSGFLIVAALINSSKAAITTTAPAPSTITVTPNSIVVPLGSTATKRPSPEPAPAAKKIARTEATAVTTKSSSKMMPPSAPINSTLSSATLQFLLQQQTKTPIVPQLFTGKLSRREIDETLTRLLEATQYLLLASQEAVDDDKEGSPIGESEGEEEEADDAEKSDEQAAGQTHHGLKTQPGIKTDDIPSSAALKKMTSKERRQLRNKISARNFRVRRKGKKTRSSLSPRSCDWRVLDTH